LHIFIGKEGQTAHVLDGSTAKIFPFSMIRPAAAAKLHADEQAERIRADGIKAMVALRSGTAEYGPLRNRLSDRNYRQGNEQENVQGNTEEGDVQGNKKEDDAQVLCAAKDETSVDIMRRMFCYNFLRKSRL
jgi:hypothetical protein